jgi:hypothetical protein
LPEVSPAIFAHLTDLERECKLRSLIARRMRRCDGLSPSRASGSARLTMTDIAYER